MNKKPLPIGIENFKEASQRYYVDKTLFIEDLVAQCEYKSVLITRPRRFGKSIALSMVDYFFNRVCKVGGKHNIAEFVYISLLDT